MIDFIPISKPSITQVEKDFVMDAVNSGWVSSLGKYIDLFEKEFAEFCGTKYALTTCNGTTAIHLALVANGIGPGDEVIVPDFTFVATANAVLYAGATPIFADIDPLSLCIDPESIKSLITTNTKAIIPVHLYGHPCDMQAIDKIGDEHNVLVIEDAAEAHGASIGNKKVGSFGICGTFSFYGNKNMTTGEGGMITTDDEGLYRKCLHLRDHAMSKDKRYWHDELGYNYRMTNIQAAIGYGQLRRINELLAKRQQIFEWYSSYLKGVDQIQLNQSHEWANSCYWLITAQIRDLDIEQREGLMKKLKSQNIDSRPFFYPVSDLPYFESKLNKNTQEIYKRGINLPTFVEMDENQVKYICENLIKAVQLM